MPRRRPAELPRLNRSKIGSRSSAGTPGPSSSTAMSTASSRLPQLDRGWRRRRTWPALSSRLAITRDSRRLSALTTHAGQVGVDVDRHVDVGRAVHGLHDQLGDAHLLEVEVHDAGVEAGDLEQVLDQLLEALDVGDHQVERGPRPVGHVVALVLEHLDRRGQRHERRAQLVADVGREPGVALDPLLEGDRPSR